MLYLIPANVNRGGLFGIDSNLTLHIPSPTELRTVRFGLSKWTDFDFRRPPRSTSYGADEERPPIQLERDSVYCIDLQRYGGALYVSTLGGEPRTLTFSERQSVLKELFPDGAARVQAEKERKEAEEQERQRRLKNIGARINTGPKINRLAAQIGRNNKQPDGFTKLSGTLKQVAFAILIREAVAKKTPEHPDLRKKITKAKYWINNHIRALEAE